MRLCGCLGYGQRLALGRSLRTTGALRKPGGSPRRRDSHAVKTRARKVTEGRQLGTGPPTACQCSWSTGSLPHGGTILTRLSGSELGQKVLSDCSHSCVARQVEPAPSCPCSAWDRELSPAARSPIAQPSRPPRTRFPEGERCLQPRRVEPLRPALTGCPALWLPSQSTASVTSGCEMRGWTAGGGGRRRRNTFNPVALAEGDLDEHSTDESESLRLHLRKCADF